MKNTYITALHAATTRELVDKINQCKIPQADIVTILKENETFILLYYASEG